MMFKLADLADIDQLIVLVQRLYAFDTLRFSAASARSALQEILGNESLGQIWLIQYQKNLIGYFVLTRAFSVEFGGAVAFVDELYIGSEYRRQGIGKKVLRFIEELARDSGIKALRLEVIHSNSAAYDFYRNNGFEDHARYLMTRLIS